GAEQQFPRPLSGGALRSLQGPLRDDGQYAGYDLAAAAGPHGDHRDRRLYRGGKGRHRAAAPRAEAGARAWDRGAEHVHWQGHRGEVMRESAQAALSYVRGHAKEFGASEDFYEKHDIHIHVPAGATPKDGPSAGITMTTALASLFSGRPVKPRIAMTGEVTLSGKVLPIGGVKEKVLGARRAGIRTVILPQRNRKDLMEDLPEEVRKEM